MIAAIYCRVSTEDQDATKQEQLCRSYCKRQDAPIEIFKVYQDIISGATTKRPEFSEMLQDMRDNKFDTIIVTKLDRIGRSLAHLLSLFAEFSKRGIDFVAITQNIDTSTAAGKLQLHILSAFAEFERNIISERTKEGLRYAKGTKKRGKDKKPRRTAGYKERYNKGGQKAWLEV